MNNPETYKAICDVIDQRIPGFSIGYKDQNVISKIIGVLSYPFNRKYMTHFTTTRYPRVFYPSQDYIRANWSRAWKILAHEYVHLHDRQERGLAFNFSYVFPQVLAVLALTALCAIWVGPLGLLGLTPLLALLPWPSPGRRDIELRGYMMSMAVNYWRYRSIRPETIEWVAKQFTGPSYYFMWPFKKSIDEKLQKAVRDIESEVVLNDPIFREIYDILTGDTV